MRLKIVIPILALSLFSCGSPSDNKASEITDSVEPDGHEHASGTDAIELNNGEKWKVDSNMMIHIRNMENDVVAFGNSEQKDYKVLSAKLQANIDLLTSNCTMKGKAHDELHKWLLPYIDMVDELANAQGDEDAAKKFQDIQSAFVTFNQFFE